MPILFPVVDILNHSVSARVEWDFQPHTSFSLKLLDGEIFTAGQELFNNYAPKQNDELLLGYGFCLENNPMEQFPLKLAFPPMLRQYAQEAGLFEPANVPYGMDADFLNKDPNAEQQFLRPKGHPFGRYRNRVPFFCGIPPFIVHFFFVQALLSLELDVQEVNVQTPGPKITLHILTLLHQALSQRSRPLPLAVPLQPQNDKQRYGKIYRDGQAKIVHSVCHELQTALDRIRAPRDKVLLQLPTLVTPAEVLATLANRSIVQRFKSGLEKHDLQSTADDALIWTLLLTCLAASLLIGEDHEGKLINEWLCTLYANYTLPTLEDGIEDADTYTFVDESLADFLHLQGHEDKEDLTETLDTIGENMGSLKDNLGDYKSVLVRGPTENLGARIIMWSMKVVQGELIPLFEDGVTKMSMYVVPWKAGGNGGEAESWMYT